MKNINSLPKWARAELLRLYKKAKEVEKLKLERYWHEHDGLYVEIVDDEQCVYSGMLQLDEEKSEKLFKKETK
jgi:hypothetical protein